MTIPEVLSCRKFDERILRILTADNISDSMRGDVLPAVVDDEYGGDYSRKIRGYADVILASIARLQERGLLSMYEDEGGNKVSVLSGY